MYALEDGEIFLLELDGFPTFWYVTLGFQNFVMVPFLHEAFSYLAVSHAAEIAMGMSKDEQSFRNLSLSFRGAERQPPTVLQMALRFSNVMERQSASMSGNTESRLKKVVAMFN